MTPFSVLLSLYYKEKPEFLKQALQSVFGQSYVPTEVVLVLDGEITSGLHDIVNQYKKLYPNIFKIVPLEKNVGLGLALNEGLKHCTCELVARMDTDDICKWDRFEKQIDIFEKYPELSVVGCWVDEFVNIPNDSITQRRVPKLNSELIIFAKSRNPLNHPTVMFKKKDIENVGGYQSFYLFEDYYLWARLISSKYEFYNIQESLLYFRSNPQMISRRGGWKYALSETKFFWILYRLRLYGLTYLVKNILIRFPVRIAPAKIRSHIYKKLLR